MCKDIDKSVEELEMSAEGLADQTAETAEDIKDTVTAEAEQAAEAEKTHVSDEAARIAEESRRYVREAYGEAEAAEEELREAVHETAGTDVPPIIEEIIPDAPGSREEEYNAYRNPYANDKRFSSNYAADAQPEQKEKTGLGRKIMVVALCAILFGALAGFTFWGVTKITGTRNGRPTADNSTELTIAPNDASKSAEADVEPKHEKESDKAAEKPTAANTETFAPIETASADSSARIAGPLDVSEIAEKATPSIVAITNVSVQEVQNNFGFFFGGNNGTYQQEVKSAGSGIIIGKNDSELLILTNYHVVSNSESLSVCFADNQVYEAIYKGGDADVDLALIVVKLADISEDTMSRISIATLGDSDAIKVGQQVVAIGNALGEGQSVTTGIISAKERSVSTSTALLIQTDAAINPGNSGGALLNMNGEVIGINSAKYSDTNVEGMGYAIPSAVAETVINDLMNRVTREKVAEGEEGYLGISGATVSSSVSSFYGIPEGVYVSETFEGGAARNAGIPDRAVITKFDGVSVRSIEALKELLTYYRVGETVEVTAQVIEGSEYVEKTFSVTLTDSSSVQNNNSSRPER